MSVRFKLGPRAKKQLAICAKTSHWTTISLTCLWQLLAAVVTPKCLFYGDRKRRRNRENAQNISNNKLPTKENKHTLLSFKKRRRSNQVTRAVVWRRHRRLTPGTTFTGNEH